MIAVFGLQMKAADQFDEIDLRGGWELVSYSGDYYLFTYPYVSEYEGSFSEFKYMILDNFILASDYDYDYIINLPEFTPSSKYEEWLCIGGFFSTKGSGNQTRDGFMEDIIMDYFISNNNKLHIQLSATALHFVIESLTSTEMRLKSFDGKFTATYKRISDPSNVNALTVQSTSEEIYKLNGIKTRTPSKGINIIRRGKKVTKNIF